MIPSHALLGCSCAWKLWDKVCTIQEAVKESMMSNSRDELMIALQLSSYTHFLSAHIGFCYSRTCGHSVYIICQIFSLTLFQTSVRHYVPLHLDARKQFLFPSKPSVGLLPEFGLVNRIMYSFWIRRFFRSFFFPPCGCEVNPIWNMKIFCLLVNGRLLFFNFSCLNCFNCERCSTQMPGWSTKKRARWILYLLALISVTFFFPVCLFVCLFKRVA